MIDGTETERGCFFFIMVLNIAKYVFLTSNFLFLVWPFTVNHIENNTVYEIVELLNRKFLNAGQNFCAATINYLGNFGSKPL